MQSCITCYHIQVTCKDSAYDKKEKAIKPHWCEFPLYRYTRFSPISTITYSSTILWSLYSPILNLSPLLQIPVSQFFTLFPATILTSAHLYLSSFVFQTSLFRGLLISFPSVCYFPFSLIPTFFSTFMFLYKPKNNRMVSKSD